MMVKAVVIITRIKNTTKIVVVDQARIEIITLPMIEMADMIVPITYIRRLYPILNTYDNISDYYKKFKAANNLKKPTQPIITKNCQRKCRVLKLTMCATFFSQATKYCLSKNSRQGKSGCKI